MVEEARFGKIGNWWTSLEQAHKTPGHSSESLYLYEWAERPVILSEGYYAMNLPESEGFTDGHDLVRTIGRELDSMFLHNLNSVNREYSEGGFRGHFMNKLKDPGFLHHVVFWDYTKDPTAIAFEWHHFHEHYQLCREMLNGQNYDVHGRPVLTNAISGSWERLLTLYHAELESNSQSDYSYKLFSEVLGWPLS
ncbi:hypothetical protein IJG98_00075 [Candidatus Saccharibacteria bacterium]|nr:hypothetical protein [Candidatus Saccharibacteria bacterium]